MFVLCLSLAVVLLDQLTKYLTRCFLLTDPVTLIPGLFNLRYVRNTGAAFGMFTGHNGALVILSVVMLAILIAGRRHFITDHRLHRTAMGLMIGGIVGNLVDRVRLGFVVDFLDFHWGTHHFPAFNVADSCICIGVGLYILSQFLVKEAKELSGAGPAEVPGEAA